MTMFQIIRLYLIIGIIITLTGIGVSDDDEFDDNAYEAGYDAEELEYDDPEIEN